MSSRSKRYAEQLKNDIANLITQYRMYIYPEGEDPPLGALVEVYTQNHYIRLAWDRSDFSVQMGLRDSSKRYRPDKVLAAQGIKNIFCGNYQAFVDVFIRYHEELLQTDIYHRLDSELIPDEELTCVLCQKLNPERRATLRYTAIGRIVPDLPICATCQTNRWMWFLIYKFLLPALVLLLLIAVFQGSQDAFAKIIFAFTLIFILISSTGQWLQEMYFNRRINAWIDADRERWLHYYHNSRVIPHRWYRLRERQGYYRDYSDDDYHDYGDYRNYYRDSR